MKKLRTIHAYNTQYKKVLYPDDESKENSKFKEAEYVFWLRNNVHKLMPFLNHQSEKCFVKLKMR